MAREAAAADITTVVCTPHVYEYEVNLLREAQRVVTALRAALAAEGVALNLRLGFEATLEVAALASLDADAGKLQALTVEGTEVAGGGGVLVIEVPFHGWPVYFHETVFRLSSRGFIPVLAHPERNDRVQNDPAILEPCLEAGAVLQATAGSLSPLFRRESKRVFRELLERGWYSVLASDAHADTEYTYTLAPLLAELRGRVPETVLQTLTCENPRLLLAGERPRPPSALAH
jgi:protein-tyrosine phosphatase